MFKRTESYKTELTKNILKSTFQEQFSQTTSISEKRRELILGYLGQRAEEWGGVG